MARKRYTPEQIISKLRAIEVHISSGMTQEQAAHITPGSPWENGYIESFNGKLADELLEREVFDTLHEAKVLIERWRVHYNTIRPHSSLGYRPPAPEAWWVEEPGSAALPPALQPKEQALGLT